MTPTDGASPGTGTWSYGELSDIRKSIEDAGLVLEAIENFDPGFWYDVLLDGPKKVEQMEGLKRLIRNIGRAGIPVMGYNFSLAGVVSRISGPFARGGAESVGVDGNDDLLPRGMVWNMFYDPRSTEGSQLCLANHLRGALETVRVVPRGAAARCRGVEREVGSPPG